jgi:(1->4)-alpha-D-glucan 1-alpha-D-glucosylmutase
MGDIYQGDLMWLFLINDPDNRRPVDWKVVTEALACFEQGVLPTFETAKLFVVWQVLKLRQRYADAFAGDSYTPVDGGSDVFAYQRGDSVQVHVPLRPGAKVTGPGEGWRNVLKDLDGLDGLGESFSLGVFERVS